MKDVESITVRKLIVAARRRGERVKDIARMFGVCRKTVWKWWKRTRKRGGISLKSLSRKPHTIYKKVDRQIENQILALRTAFKWGTDRLRKYLISSPRYVKDFIRKATGKRFKSCLLSRQAINEILARHNLNGSPYRAVKDWKFFSAENPNDMWQIDLKGPCLIGDKKRYLLVVLDDHSRYLILVEILDSIKAEDVTSALEVLLRRRKTMPHVFLSDNGPQFKVDFEKWCKLKGIEVEHTPPHYPQSKGKVERSIRNISEEFLRLNPHLTDVVSDLKEFVRWYNNERFHMGINAIPSDIYFGHGNVTDLG
jgi:transposase InsO family protein